MKILIISDIHYGENTDYPDCGGENYVNQFGSQFENFLPKIHSLISNHDLVINLGDLIHETDTESDLIQYKKTMELFGKEKPVKHVFGNHDVRTLSREQLSEIIGEERPYYSFDLGEYHHVILDSFRNNRKELCRIDEEQLSWLRNDLDKTNLSTIVYCHYLLDNQSIDDNLYFKEKQDRVFINNKKEVRSIFESSNKVIAVFGGHLHFFHEEKINNILYVTVPAFTENDGNHKPKAECLSVKIDNSDIKISIKNLI